MKHDETDDDAEDTSPDVPETCEKCGEETIHPLEECPACGRFLCVSCIGIHSCDDADTPSEEEDEDERY